MTRLVVGAVILDSLAHPTQVLAARRSRPVDLAGCWEFPGGKIEAGETPQEGLAREVGEELGVEIVVGTELGGPWAISERLELRLYLCQITSGELTPGETHDEVRWLSPDQLDEVSWLPADEAALPAVRQHL